tara:strand:+ start:1214 stop:1420 length:207 start_codon:yes stop_codon:yes gene_type:complete
MYFKAKPNMLNNTGMKIFRHEDEAIKYLEQYTGHELASECIRKTKKGKITRSYHSDWYVLGKLTRMEA